MPAEWRLIIDGPVPGAWNMALDRAVQLSRQAGEAPPTLRIYGWERPTVTLGRFQSAEDVDRELCDVRGIDIVRRFTGGRGVLHADELTYSVVASVDDGVPTGTSASYAYLCGALTLVYRELGVDAALTPRPRGAEGRAACYLHATAADLSLGARKLSGSAQVWHQGTVMQHGSFVRSRDAYLEAAVFRLDGVGAHELELQTATLEDALGEPPSLERMIEAVTNGFEEALGIRLIRGELTDRERAAAAELLVDVDPDNEQRRHRVRASS